MKFSFRKNRVFIVVIGILLIVTLNFFQGEVRNFFYFLSEPVQRVLWQRGKDVSGFLEGILRSKSLLEELDSTKIENQALLAEIERLKSLKKENDFLKEALRIGIEKDFELVLANAISKEPFEDSILIDAGKREGVLENCPVINHQGVLLGKVSEVYEDFSRVLLTSHKEMSFSAKIQRIIEKPDNETQSEGEEQVSGELEELFPSEVEEVASSKIVVEEIKGAVKGKGNLRLSFELVLREAKIEAGDVLVTDALGGVFPQALIVGKVENIERLAIEPFQRAEVVPLFELKEIEQVFIIKKW